MLQIYTYVSSGTLKRKYCITIGLTFTKVEYYFFFFFFFYGGGYQLHNNLFWPLFLQNMKIRTKEIDENEKIEDTPYRICCITSDKSETIRNFICLCQ